jgi:hypothetical protein
MYVESRTGLEESGVQAHSVRRMAQRAWGMEFSAQTFEDVPRVSNGEKPT